MNNNNTNHTIHFNDSTASFLRFENVYFSWPALYSHKKYKALKNAINIQDIEQSLLHSLLLNDISIDIAHHECVGIQGYTGAGKTTFANLLSGFLFPIAGNLYVNNEKQDYSSYRKKMYLQYQMVYQQPLASFNPRISIYQSMCDAFIAYKKIYQKQSIYELGNKKKKICKKNILELFHHELSDILQKIDMNFNILERFPHQVSGGELQRLSLARVFIVKPKLIILDEPVSFLDNMLQKQILDILLNLFSCYKSSVVLISHLEEVLEYTCSKIYILSEKKLKRVLH